MENGVGWSAMAGVVVAACLLAASAPALAAGQTGGAAPTGLSGRGAGGLDTGRLGSSRLGGNGLGLPSDLVLPNLPAAPATPGLNLPAGSLSQNGCLTCSTIGGGSGPSGGGTLGGGSGGLTLTPSAPATHATPLPVCKPGEQLLILGGTARCV